MERMARCVCENGGRRCEELGCGYGWGMGNGECEIGDVRCEIGDEGEQSF